MANVVKKPVYLTPEQIKDVSALAAQEQRSFSNQIRRIISTSVEKHQLQKGRD